MENDKGGTLRQGRREALKELIFGVQRLLIVHHMHKTEGIGSKQKRALAFPRVGKDAGSRDWLWHIVLLCQPVCHPQRDGVLRSFLPPAPCVWLRPPGEGREKAS